MNTLPDKTDQRMKRQLFGFMDTQLFKHPRECDQRIETLEAMIKAHKRNSKDGIGTFKAELAAVKRRRRELRRAMQLVLPI
jgi:lipopolysaccharide biosynthesis regulator YciM